jgi:hypothetical protein
LELPVVSPQLLDLIPELAVRLLQGIHLGAKQIDFKKQSRLGNIPVPFSMYTESPPVALTQTLSLMHFLLHIRVNGYGMMQVGVQGGDQRGSFHDDPHARMAVALDVTLGTAKEPFQIQIVTRKVGHLFADEQARDKGAHGLGHRLPPRMVGRLEAPLQRTKKGPTPGHAAAVGIESGGDLAKVLDPILPGLLLLLDVGNAPVNGVRQSLQSLVCRPPFFASRFRWREDRISPRAFAIFNPGGCKGPPGRQ